MEPKRELQVAIQKALKLHRNPYEAGIPSLCSDHPTDLKFDQRSETWEKGISVRFGSLSLPKSFPLQL
ncbi:hypothetical protein ACFX13_018019 [Malus domestica]